MKLILDLNKNSSKENFSKSVKENQRKSNNSKVHPESDHPSKKENIDKVPGEAMGRKLLFKKLLKLVFK